MTPRSSISEQSGLTRLTFTLSGDVVLSKNLIPQINGQNYLLPVEAYAQPGVYTLEYHAGSLMSVSKYLRQNKLARQQTIRLLKEICRPVMEARAVGLYPENFSYDADHIFIDNQSGSVKLTYFPFETGGQSDQALRALLSKLIGELLCPAGDDNKYIARLMENCGQYTFTAASFHTLLDELDAADYEPQLEKKRKSEKTPKPEKEQKAKSSRGLLHRLFGKREEPPVPIPVYEKPRPVPVPQRRQQGGTVVLLPDNGVNGGVQTGKPFLEIELITNGESSHVVIDSFPCVFGRSRRDSDTVLDDSNVSRKHAVLDYSDGAFIVTDCNSTNGTVVNGMKLPSGGAAMITAGDVIKLGRVELRISLG